MYLCGIQRLCGVGRCEVVDIIDFIHRRTANMNSWGLWKLRGQSGGSTRHPAAFEWIVQSDLVTISSKCNFVATSVHPSCVLWVSVVSQCWCAYTSATSLNYFFGKKTKQLDLVGTQSWLCQYRLLTNLHQLFMTSSVPFFKIQSIQP